MYCGFDSVQIDADLLFGKIKSAPIETRIILVNIGALAFVVSKVAHTPRRGGYNH